MATINVYLSFDGNTEVVFNFYKDAFGTEFIDGGIKRFRDMPDNDKIAGGDLDKVMHVSLPVGKGNTLMGNDILESWGQKSIPGNNVSISINADSKEEADRLFNALSNGGNITMPLADTFWGAYFGMFTDKFGINWMVNFDYNQKK